MWIKLLINIILLCNIIDCLPSIPGSLENAFVLKRLTKLYTLQSKAKLSELCEKQSKIYNKELYNGTSWALEMMDASSKLQPGIAGWNLADLGNFDQCLSINNIGNNIKGKFCYTRIKFMPNQGLSSKMFDLQRQKEHLLRNSIIVQPRDNNDFINDLMALRWSFCVPDGCSALDVQAHLNKFFISNENGTLFNVRETDCQTLESQPKLSAADWTVIGFLIAIGCIVILSTIYDLCLYYTEKQTAYPLLIAFSWFTNFRKFIKVNNNPDQLLCLNGIRFISMLWIIHGHQIFYSLFEVIFNLKDAVQWMNTFWANATTGSTVSVDTFFLLSGCLLMYGFLKAQAKNIPFNVPVMYLHRYLRLTPMCVVVMILSMTLCIHMSSGPIWLTSNEGEMDRCRRYWWTVLLYIQNFVNPNEMCIAQTWYLQIDMQLFLVSPLILYSVSKFPKYASYIFCTLIVIFTLTPIGIVWYYDLGLSAGSSMDHYYANTFARAGPWFVGLALGYVLFHRKQNKYQINMTSNSVLWIVSLLVLFYTVFGNYAATKMNYINNRVYAILFMGLHRNVWAIFVGLIIFACVQGYGGPVNWFLSLPMFQILGRLTYSMYLTQMIVMAVTGPKRTPTYFSNLNLLLSAIGTVGITLIVSLICLLTFETPFSVIDNVLFGQLSKLSNQKSKSNEITDPKVEA